jgi:hypothetical protein
MLNWFCLAGAMRELGLPLDWSAFTATDVFNSNKCFAVFQTDNSNKRDGRDNKQEAAQ